MESSASSPISLHALVLGTRRVDSDALIEAIQQCFPGSEATATHRSREAIQWVRDSVFDLVVLAMDPLRPTHIELIESLRRHPTSMPTLLLVGARQEDELIRACPDLPTNWEILPLEGFSADMFSHRVRKAIDGHEHLWELKHLRQAFHSSLSQYRNLFDEVPDVIFLCDRTGCLLELNETAARMFGKPLQSMLMRPLSEVFGLPDRQLQRILNLALRHEGPAEDVEVFFEPEGHPPVYGLMHVIPRGQGEGRQLQFQGVIKDITPHKHLENRLRRSEDQYKTLYELAGICSSSLSIDEVVNESVKLIHRCCEARGSMLLFNQAYEELGISTSREIPDAVMARFEDAGAPLIGRGVIGRMAIEPGIHVVERDGAEDLHPAFRAWMDALPDCHLIGIALGLQSPVLPRTLLLMMAPADSGLHENSALLDGLRRTLEIGMTNCLHHANVQEAEARYRDLWEEAPALFLSILSGGIIFEVNHTAARALGYELKELIGQPIHKIIDPADHELFNRHHKMRLDSDEAQAYEINLVKSNGQRMIVSIQSEKLLDRDGQCIGEKSIMHDITRDREMKARLRHYAENLEKMVADRTAELTQTMTFLNGILEGSTEYAILGLDDRGRLLHFNRGAQIIFGHEADDMVDQHTLARLIDFEQNKVGSLEALLQEVERKRVFVSEMTLKTSVGQSLIALMTINRLNVTTANNLTYVAIIRDITEQKEMEDLLKLYTENLQQVIEQKTREIDRQHMQLIQSSKLATLGEMATGIAHEMNQPLSGIRTRAQFIEMALDRGIVDAEKIKRNQLEVIQLVDRITTIIHHMRIFARQDQHEFSKFSIQRSIQGAMSLIGEQLRIHGIEVYMEVPDDLPPILGEPLQLEQVLINLISNARDAMDSHADLLRREEGPEAASDYHKRLVVEAGVTEQDEMCVRVCDNGAGMDEEIKARVFEPFYTTKPVGRGTGLGLSISYGIITNHHGRIEVDTEPGGGTAFKLYLPLAEPARQVDAAPHPEADKAPARGLLDEAGS